MGSATDLASPARQRSRVGSLRYRAESEGLTHTAGSALMSSALAACSAGHRSLCSSQTLTLRAPPIRSPCLVSEKPCPANAATPVRRLSHGAPCFTPGGDLLRLLLTTVCHCWFAPGCAACARCSVPAFRSGCDCPRGAPSGTRAPPSTCTRALICTHTATYQRPAPAWTPGCAAAPPATRPTCPGPQGVSGPATCMSGRRATAEGPRR